MASIDERYEALAAGSHLPPDAARQLLDIGFVVMRGPIASDDVPRVQDAYDRAVATADAADVRISSSTRVTDFVNRGPEFDSIYVYPPLLAACCLVIGEPFKLSGTRARTLEPGAPCESLHIDAKHRADGWPLVGFILMIDAFDAENGATRFVPGTHLQPCEPGAAMAERNYVHHEQVLACAPAGSIIIFNGSTWHGHTANRSQRRRRSVQGHFIPRPAKGSVDHSARMRPEVLARIGDLARYVLALD
jgi:ectoine hydroxylase-related dioxygenase (phytanoyl-CoA dioxygenase family)